MCVKFLRRVPALLSGLVTSAAMVMTSLPLSLLYIYFTYRVMAVATSMSMTWTVWSPSPGYYLGISDDNATFYDLTTKCDHYGTEPIKDGVQLDFYGAEFISFMKTYCPDFESCWTADIDPLMGACIAVVFDQDKVYIMDHDCNDRLRYICYGIPKSGETTEVQDTTWAYPTTPPNQETTETTPPGDVTSSDAADTTVIEVTSSLNAWSDDYTTENDVSKTLPQFANFSELNWNQWTPWSVCTSTCNGGQKLRLQLCAGVLECQYQLTSVRNITISYNLEWERCSVEPCPVDGVWLTWQQWGDCSVTCETGTRQRYRLCAGPYNGGEPCPGEHHVTEFCSLTDHCPFTMKEVPHEEYFKESDSRPSAIGVGVISLAFVIAELGLIICFDIWTISQQYQQRRRHERSTKKPEVKQSRRTISKSSSESDYRETNQATEI